MFLDSFTFGDTDRHVYPHRVLAAKKLGRIDFAPITIFYGGNGSGKSTVLNVIARTIGVRRMSLGNTSDYFRYYTERCSFDSSWPINTRSARFIRSEDVMEGILEIREKTGAEVIDKGSGEWYYSKNKSLSRYREIGKMVTEKRRYRRSVCALSCVSCRRSARLFSYFMEENGYEA